MQVNTSLEDKLRGYGMYKVGTTGKAPDPENRPSMLYFTDRQKWFAWEAAWEETGGDHKKAQENYVKHTEKLNSVTIE